MKRFSPIIALSFFLLVACSTVTLHTAPMQPGTKDIQLLSIDGSMMTIAAEIADTPEAREQGLMERKGLAENEGMIFIFPDERQMTFWMKNTLIPLDVLFFDKNGNFLSSQTMQPCTGDPCNLYPSGKPAKYALELAAGFVTMKGVGLGWRLVLPVR